MSDLAERLRVPYAESSARPNPALMELQRHEAADEIERLHTALDALLCEAEDVFVCMADATGIDRKNYPDAFRAARAALERKP